MSEQKRVPLAIILGTLLTLAVIVAGCTSSSSNAPSTTPAQSSANGSLPATANASTVSVKSENTSMTKTANATNATQTEPIRVTQGASFTITLRSNPSTGYFWEPHFDQVSLSLTNSSFISDPNPNNLVGVPGSQVFTFQSHTKGTTTITFDNISPSGTVTEQTMYTVTVS